MVSAHATCAGACLVALAACESGTPAQEATFDAGGDAAGAGSDASTADATPLAPDGSAPATPLVLSPTCGAVGAPVVLKLAKDGLPPTCVRTSDFAIQFAGAWLLQPDEAALASDGYCLLSLHVPEKATTGRIEVKASGDRPPKAWASVEPFRVPCP